ncbi:alpha-ketoacid dehydrogenase subunit beta [Tenuibacillus multivorans]|uniref:Pyruvate dehydrogenase E1 component beta subunit n=1 Tax=Tenuibacillus multivorans TaxID=237069 RepID=A0A1H0BW59_9BACI|nr:alpha-ketoacid dehydrogenase subunit beta [Tenuibacillus multivorans]GEL77011.1 2-oxoisovalerate dehydrogenase subunit beta [Tenuibacillus multivorans]SDN49835.1 pyruvate dehydrogenase E1 component beta subunit [Tenuibacillus multivorans]
MDVKTETKTQVNTTQKLTMVQAVNDALKTMLESDKTTMLLGEDIGKNGGVFRATEGLQEQFGEDRVVDTPLSESGIVGTSVGLAVNGFKPVAEMQFMGFIYPAFDQLMTHVSRIRAKTMGHYSVPLVVRAPYGAGIRAPEIHSDSAEAIFTHMPGIKVVCPSTPYDAKGLLIASIEDPDPVIFMEPMRSYRAQREEVPEGKYTLEIGKGKRVQEGTDVTVIAWGAMLPVAQQAVKQAEQQGMSCEVLDLKTLYPLDRDLIAESVQKTGRAVIVHEAQSTGGLGQDIMSVIHDTSFLYLRAPIERVTGFDVPVPFFALEDHHLPTPKRVLASIEKAVHF